MRLVDLCQFLIVHRSFHQKSNHIPSVAIVTFGIVSVWQLCFGVYFLSIQTWRLAWALTSWKRVSTIPCDHNGRSLPRFCAEKSYESRNNGNHNRWYSQLVHSNMKNPNLWPQPTLDLILSRVEVGVRSNNTHLCLWTPIKSFSIPHRISRETQTPTQSQT